MKKRKNWMTLIVSMGWMMQVASIPEAPPLTTGFTFDQNHLNRRLRLLNFSLFAFWSKQSIKQSETQNSERRKKRWEREWQWFWYYRDRKSKKNPRKETENNGKSYGGSASRRRQVEPLIGDCSFVLLLRRSRQRGWAHDGLCGVSRWLRNDEAERERREVEKA